jgi:peptidoglycan/LPS O-acetylase OafA/YrhL
LTTAHVRPADLASSVAAPAPEGARRPNLAALDGLRGFLATYVLLGHARWLLWAGYADWIKHPHAGWAVRLAQAAAGLRFGHEAVMVFFVLSGYFIHLRMARRLLDGRAAAFEVAPYFRRRFHRLAAPYFLALTVTVLCDVVGRTWFPELYAAHTGDPTLDLNFARKGYSLQAVLPAMALLPTSLGRDFGTNGPLWSLSFEVVYYLFYPLWLLVRRRSALLAYGAIPVLALLLGFLPQGGYAATVASHYPIWLAGAALAELSVRRGPSRSGLSLATLLAVASFGAFLLWPGTSFLRVVVCAIGYGGAATWAFSALPAGARWLRPLQFLGLRSYTIYVVHFPVLALGSAMVFHLNGGRPQSGLLAVAGAAASLLVALVCFEVCERHFVHERIRLEAKAAP